MKDRLTPNRTVHHLSSLNNTPCAVILPILTIGGEEHILFEVRSSKLAWQPRDICFPGGRIEKTMPVPLTRPYGKQWKSWGWTAAI